MTIVRARCIKVTALILMLSMCGLLWLHHPWINREVETVARIFQKLDSVSLSTLTTRLPTIPRRLSLHTYLHENSTDKAYEHAHSYFYKPTIQPNRRCSPSTFLLVGVITPPSSFTHRQVYRDTVLSPLISSCMQDIQYLFIVGATEDPRLQQQLNIENAKYGDIVQGNFTDSYQNLTYKSLFLLHWSLQNCPSAQYTFKLDDDVFVILEDVYRYLKLTSLSEYSIIGSVFKGARPNHNKASKWYVDNFHEKEFPTYVSGTAYLLSRSLLKPIFEAAMTLSFVRLEDVFVTGISARKTKLNIEHHQFPGFDYVESTFNIQSTNFSMKKSIHGVNSEQMKFLYLKLVADKITRC